MMVEQMNRAAPWRDVCDCLAVAVRLQLCKDAPRLAAEARKAELQAGVLIVASAAQPLAAAGRRCRGCLPWSRCTQHARHRCRRYQLVQDAALGAAGSASGSRRDSGAGSPRCPSRPAGRCQTPRRWRAPECLSAWCSSRRWTTPPVSSYPVHLSSSWSCSLSR